MTLGAKIKELRERHGYSQQALADQINRICNTQLKRNTISNYEREKSFPDYDKLAAIVNILDTTCDDLLGLNSGHQNDNKSNTNKNKAISINEVEEPKAFDSHCYAFQGSGLIQKSQKCKYIPAIEHKNYLTNYQNPLYISSLPNILIPYLNGTRLRAFEITRGQLTQYIPNLKNGDVLIGESVSKQQLQDSSALYIILHRAKGIELVNIVDLLKYVHSPSLLEIWRVRASINYEVSVLNEPSNLMKTLLKRVERLERYLN